MIIFHGSHYNTYTLTQTLRGTNHILYLLWAYLNKLPKHFLSYPRMLPMKEVLGVSQRLALPLWCSKKGWGMEQTIKQSVSAVLYEVKWRNYGEPAESSKWDFLMGWVSSAPTGPGNMGTLPASSAFGDTERWLYRGRNKRASMDFVIRGDSGCNLTPTPSPGPWVLEGRTVIQLGQIKGRDFRSRKPMQR